MFNFILIVAMATFQQPVPPVCIGYTPPTQRENNDPLPNSEIAAYVLFVNGTPLRRIEKSQNPYCFEATKAACYTMKTIDTDGVMSTIFSNKTCT